MDNFSRKIELKLITFVPVWTGIWCLWMPLNPCVTCWLWWIPRSCRCLSMVLRTSSDWENRRPNRTEQASTLTVLSLRRLMVQLSSTSHMQHPRNVQNTSKYIFENTSSNTWLWDVLRIGLVQTEKCNLTCSLLHSTVVCSMWDILKPRRRRWPLVWEHESPLLWPPRCPRLDTPLISVGLRVFFWQGLIRLLLFSFHEGSSWYII